MGRKEICVQPTFLFRWPCGGNAGLCVRLFYFLCKSYIYWIYTIYFFGEHIIVHGTILILCSCYLYELRSKSGKSLVYKGHWSLEMMALSQEMVRVVYSTFLSLVKCRFCHIFLLPVLLNVILGGLNVL